MRAITTLEANCQDCHRCMRECPLKAIGIEQGQAHLIDEKCVLCGRCVVECPQAAKVVENRLAIVRGAIAAGRQVVLSLAPSFAAVFGEYQPPELWRRLYNLGFSAVEETAVGAEAVAGVYGQLVAAKAGTVISACCPVVVSTIEKYYPALCGSIAPVISPMHAHGRMLRERFGAEALVVFAGPCIAKIAEREQDGNQVDVVITFEQLKDWLAESYGGAGDAGGAKENSVQPSKGARCFPVVGGVLKAFTRSEYTDTEIIAVDGLQKCMKVFDALTRGEIAPAFIEAMACDGGCIEGPANGTDRYSPAKRLQVLAFAGGAAVRPAAPPRLDLRREHRPAPVVEVLPSEREIRLVLQRTGKITEKDEKNCGACGFNSCREKAIAVCQGLTTTDTCVPYMRSKAESLANIIVDNSLNAIIVVNARLVIQAFNPAAERMFDSPKEWMRGKNLSELMDCAPVAAAYRTDTKLTGGRVAIQGDVIASQMIIPVVDHDLIIVVLTDVTSEEKSLRELERMKAQTVDKASEIINKQMKVAQEIAGLLGETTAETKAALLELVTLLRTKEEG